MLLLDASELCSMVRAVGLEAKTLVMPGTTSHYYVAMRRPGGAWLSLPPQPVAAYREALRAIATWKRSPLQQPLIR